MTMYEDPFAQVRDSVKSMDVGEVAKQRWNGCPTGDGRVEVCFVE